MKQLTGSEKQIKWATDLRQRFIDGFEGEHDDRFEDVLKMDSAKFWIESRSMNATQMLLVARGVLEGESLYSALRCGAGFTPQNMNSLRF